MNREIKFRAFENGKMFSWEDMKNRTQGAGSEGITLDFPLYMLSNDYGIEWMQYTGLKDKNGVEIYEGDIVKWDDQSKGKYWRVAVVLINPDIRFEIITNTLHPLSTPYPDTFKFGSFIYTDTHNHLYVVGNIYEHPNILK